MRKGFIYRFWAAALFSAGLSCNVTAQAQTQSQPQPHAQESAQAPKVLVLKDGREPKKVWTEDDLVRIRKPWDVQQDLEALAKEHADMAGTKSDVPPLSASGALGSATFLKDGSPVPRTVEEFGGKMSALQEEIAELQSDLEQTNEFYFDATDDIRRAKLKFNLDTIGADLQERQDDLKTLQVRLESLKSGKTQPPGRGE